MADYRIGLDPNNLTHLTDEPFSAVTANLLGFSVAGTPINSAFEEILWTWENMSQEAWNQVFSFWNDNVRFELPPPYVYLRSLAPDGEDYTYHIYRGKMGRPVGQANRATAQIRNASLTFYQCEVYQL